MFIYFPAFLFFRLSYRYGSRPDIRHQQAISFSSYKLKIKQAQLLDIICLLFPVGFRIFG